MYDYRCPKCKTTESFQLFPARQQLKCPKCKTRQMRDITQKYEVTSEFWDKEMCWFMQGNGPNFIGNGIVDWVDPADIKEEE